MADQPTTRSGARAFSHGSSVGDAHHLLGPLSLHANVSIVDIATLVSRPLVLGGRGIP